MGCVGILGAVGLVAGLLLSPLGAGATSSAPSAARPT